MVFLRYLPCAAVLAFVCANAGLAQDKKFEMVPVSYAALKEEVLKHRGKVVLVDFWAGY